MRIARSRSSQRGVPRRGLAFWARLSPRQSLDCFDGVAGCAASHSDPRGRQQGPLRPCSRGGHGWQPY
eukprot:scaffold2349_cov407-Prasinococcus_capsulatus_cf.AAC.9